MISTLAIQFLAISGLTIATAYVVEVPPLPGVLLGPAAIPPILPNVDIPMPAQQAAIANDQTERLPWKPEGHSKWQWRSNKINYVEMGDPSKPALLLIHGFGVSSYHFRENIPELSKHYHVFAFDMLGFGCSSMPVQDYEPEIWRDQTVDFIREVVKKPTTVAGNSLGGLTALYAAASKELKDMVSGCILMNAALRFRSTEPKHAFIAAADQVVPLTHEAVARAWGSFQRLLLGASFEFSRQPERIEKVLNHVYALNSDNVDEDLIASIQHPSMHDNAAEVYCRVLSQNGPGTNVFADDLLADLECPLFLCWGTEDPWFKTHACDKIQSLYPASRHDVAAGHCPHDEAPKEVNAAIHAFMSSLETDQSK